MQTLLPLILPNVARNRGRSILTAAGAGVAIFVFLMLGALVSRLTAPLAGMEESDVLAVRQAGRGFVLSSRLPGSYHARIADRDDTTATTGVLEEIVVHDRVHVWVRGIDPSEYREIYPLQAEPAAAWNAFDENRRAALVGHRVLSSLGWSVGSLVTLPSLGVEAQIVGELPPQSPDVADHVLVNRALLEGAREARGEVSYFLVRPTPDTDADALATRIDAEFTDSPVPTRTESSQAFAAALVDDFSGFVDYLRAMSWLALLVYALALGNAIAMSVRDRQRELATLRALGFSPGSIVTLILGESALLTGLGGIVGAILAIALLLTAASSVLIFRWLDAGLALAIAIFIGLIGGLVPAMRAARTQPAVALKGGD